MAVPVYAEQQITQERLREDIKILDSRLNKQEKKATALHEEVRVLEKKLGEQTRKAYSIEKKIKAISKRLEQTNVEKNALQLELKMHKKGLSRQLLALYSAGEQSHLRMLLKQDDPSDIGRTIKYFEYLNNSRLKKIHLTKTTLNKLHSIEKAISKDKIQLHQLSDTLLDEKKASQQTLLRREVAYNKVKKNVDYKKRKLRELKKREATLQKKFDLLVARTKKNDQQKPIKRAAPAVSTSLGDRQKNNSNNSKNRKKTPPQRVSSQPRYVADRSFSTLRGKLSWPVDGKITHVYGSRRNEKQRWKGTVIKAPGGRKVRAVAKGKVEFSGWFNGYGYLVIIRHDNNYRSLYGYNRAVYVKSGQIVNSGATIASVGNSGGQQKNALYFEIRKGTRPRNPANWCR